jgi:hypothetical protein
MVVLVPIAILSLSILAWLVTFHMYDVWQWCVWYPLVRDMGEGVSSEEECIDVQDLLRMLDPRGVRLLEALWFGGKHSTCSKVLVCGF